MCFLGIGLCIRIIQLCYDNFTSRFFIMNYVPFHFLCFSEVKWNGGRNTARLICTWSWYINTSFIKPFLLEDFDPLWKRSFIQRIWTRTRNHELPLWFLVTMKTVGRILSFMETVVGIILSRIRILIWRKKLILLISNFPKFCIFLLIKEIVRLM